MGARVINDSGYGWHVWVAGSRSFSYRWELSLEYPRRVIAPGPKKWQYRGGMSPQRAGSPEFKCQLFH